MTFCGWQAWADARCLLRGGSGPRSGVRVVGHHARHEDEDIDAHLADVATLASGASGRSRWIAVGDANADMCWRVRVAAVTDLDDEAGAAPDPRVVADAFAGHPGAERHRMRFAQHRAFARGVSAKVVVPTIGDPPGGRWSRLCSPDSRRRAPQRGMHASTMRLCRPRCSIVPPWRSRGGSRGETTLRLLLLLRHRCAAAESARGDRCLRRISSLQHVPAVAEMLRGNRSRMPPLTV